jgi:hypothetical protein
MSMRSLTDFIEASPRPVWRLASTATVTGRGTSQVDSSVRGGYFSWPPAGTSLATSGYISWPQPGTSSWPRTGWVCWQNLTPESLDKAVKFADGCGDQLVSRWRSGPEGARSVNASSVYLFPPGPRDRPLMYRIYADARGRRSHRAHRGVSGWATSLQAFQIRL